MDEHLFCALPVRPLSSSTAYHTHLHIFCRRSYSNMPVYPPRYPRDATPPPPTHIPRLELFPSNSMTTAIALPLITTAPYIVIQHHPRNRMHMAMTSTTHQATLIGWSDANAKSIRQCPKRKGRATAKGPGGCCASDSLYPLSSPPVIAAWSWLAHSMHPRIASHTPILYRPDGRMARLAILASLAVIHFEARSAFFSSFPATLSHFTLVPFIFLTVFCLLFSPLIVFRILYPWEHSHGEFAQ